MSQPRILILTNRVPYPLKDGGNLAMHAMIDGYHNAGWDVYLLAMNTTRHPVSEKQLKELYPYLSGFATVNIDNRLKPLGTIQNLLFSKQPNHAQRFSHSIFATRLRDVLHTFNPKVVQLESVFLATYLPFIREHSSAVTVLRMHNVEYQIWHRLSKKTTHAVKNLYFRNLTSRIKKFEEGAWEQVDLLLPITDADADVVKRAKIKTPVIIAPFGIDIANLPPASNGHWYGYHIGAMDWLPNAESIKWFLQQVWPELHKTIPGFKFFFAGRDMPDAFKKMNIPNVYCMGEVRDAQAFIADKKILIVPLRSGGGIRIKILEAMAAGKIVICTSVAMQGIDAKPGIHYLPANKPTEFIKSVKWCLDHQPEAEQIGANAAALIRTHYEQHLIMQNITIGLNNILAQHNGSKQ